LNTRPAARDWLTMGTRTIDQASIDAFKRISSFKDFVLHSPAAQIAAELMGSRVARFFRDHVLVKEPGTAIGLLRLRGTL
jgi:ectoine hydroxylase-related dioxygenase (phytanoyl-CoA dioxygenase family)